MPQLIHGSPSGGSPPPLLKPKEKFLSLILKAVIMTFLITFFFFLLPLASIILLIPLLLRHHRHRRCPQSSSGLSTKQLKKLPQFRFSGETDGDLFEFDVCAICLDGYKLGQWCRSLAGCGHSFHRRCLDSWLKKVAACPICRTGVCLDHEDKRIWDFGARRTDFQGLLDL